MNLKIYEVLLRKMLIDGFLRKKKVRGWEGEGMLSFVNSLCWKIQVSQVKRMASLFSQISSTFFHN
jgi:hypothetical protein